MPASFCLVATDLTEQIRSDATAASEKLARELLSASNQSRLALLNMVEDQKRAEEALRESEERFRALIQNAADLIVVIDVEGVMRYVSPSSERIMGYIPEEAVGKNFLDWVHPEDMPIAKRSLASRGKTPGTSQAIVEIRGLHKNGIWRVIEVLGTNLLAEPAIQGIVMNMRDITERKQAEEALRESEEKYRMLFEEAPVGIAISTLEGKIIDLNKGQAEMIGRTVEELRGKNVNEYYIESDKRIEMIEVLKSTGKVRDFEMNLRRSDGSIITELLNLDNVQIGTINYILAIGRDITERKLSADRIQRQLEHLTALSGIDRVISANFDLKLSLSEILNHVTIELGIDAADILILNSGLQILEFSAERGFRTKAIRKRQVRLGEGYAGRAAREHKLVQVPNIQDEPDSLFLTTLLAGEDFVCYYGVPLIIKGQVKGVLEVFHRAALRPDSEWFDFLNTLAGQAAIAVEIATLFESLQRSNSELFMAYDATIQGWSQALDLRDKETEGHSKRVTELTVELARVLGISEADLVQVRWGALLHDIGKMGVPDGILLKPSPLTDEEWVAMKKHPGLAYEMLSPIGYLRLALDIPYCHHENWDGSGYPRGLKGAQIPLVARIFAVVDVWDALRSDRPYRPAWADEKVREHIRDSSGTHFDPQVVDAFIQLQK
jgi:PAS domain S-box-containing protein/putative nucleotidyltransferase with HDIG domain